MPTKKYNQVVEILSSGLVEWNTPISCAVQAYTWRDTTEIIVKDLTLKCLVELDNGVKVLCHDEHNNVLRFVSPENVMKIEGMAPSKLYKAYNMDGSDTSRIAVRKGDCHLPYIDLRNKDRKEAEYIIFNVLRTPPPGNEGSETNIEK